MAAVISLSVLYGVVFLVFRPLGGLSVASDWLADWGRRAASV